MSNRSEALSAAKPQCLATPVQQWLKRDKPQRFERGLSPQRHLPTVQLHYFKSEQRIMPRKEAYFYVT